MTEENRKPIQYMSVCSGIEAASIAWDYLGWEPFAFSEVEPYPCAVLASRWPSVPNLGDMTKISVQENGDIKYGDGKILPNDGRPVDVLIGGTPCFAAGTMVLSEKGYVPIETLQAGDMVVTHKGRLQKVLRIGAKEADNVVDVRIRTRPTMRLTADHKFWSIKKSHHNHANHLIADEIGFEQLQNLGIGGYVAQNTKYDIPMPQLPDIRGLSHEKLLEMAGWYVGDGYIRRFTGKNKKGVVFALVNEKKINAFRDAFPMFTGTAGKDGKVVVYCTELAEWLISQFGEHALNKTIPAWLIAASQPLKDAFVSGYFATDGHYNEDDIKCFTTVSASLAYGVADMIGHTSVSKQKINPVGIIEGRLVNQHDVYYIRACNNPRYFHHYEDWDFVRISEISEPSKDIVYQIEVEEDHSYVSAGIVSANCQSFSIAGSQEGLRGVSGIVLDYVRLVYELAAYKGLRWFVHENVPNMLSCGKPKGSDYATLLSAFTGWDVDTPGDGWGNAGIIPPASEGNFGVAYRILDVQYTRVDGFPEAIPQRRRRCFTCGYLGSWQRAAEVLFEQRGLLGDLPPQRKKKQAVARTSGASTCGNDGVHASHGGVADQEAEGGSGADKGDDACGRRNADGAGDADCTGVGAFMGGQGAKAGTIAFSEECSPTVKASPSGSNTIPTVMCVHGSQDPIHNDGECANALGRNQGKETCVCCGFQQNQVGEVHEYETAPTLNTNSNASGRNAPLACVEEPSMGDGASIEGEKESFNFEMFSGECKGVSPALQAQRAKDTLVYGDEQIIESKKGGYEAANTYTACQYKGVNNQMPIAVEVYYP